MLELAGIIILGILAQWVAWRLKLPAILPLILIGLIVGPLSTLYTEDGSKIIEPIWNGDKGLFPGEGLYYFVSLAISIILFEGGLTLKRSEIKNIGPVITKLITLGSLTTFFGAALAAYFLFGLSWQLCFLFSALIIVTGPTVITPILRNIPLKKDVSAILKWEGIRFYLRVYFCTCTHIFNQKELYTTLSFKRGVLICGTRCFCNVRCFCT